MKHIVQDIRFTHKADSLLAPLSCCCGWNGTVAEWNDHRGPSANNRPRHRQREMTVVER